MPKLHVLLQQEALDPARLQDKVVIVLDILFATSAIVHTFGEEVASVWPARNHADAVRLGADCADAVLAGECLADALPNFATAAPLALGSLGLRGRRLVYSTTNGTPALHRASAARHVYSGRTVEWHHGGRPCGARASGCAGTIAVRRFAGALQPGRLLLRRPSSHLLRPFDGYHCSDAALAAAMLYRNNDARSTLLASRVVRRMHALELQCEVEYVAQCDIIAAVPQFLGDQLLQVAA